MLNNDAHEGLENLGRVCVLITLICCGSPLVALVRMLAKFLQGICLFGYLTDWFLNFRNMSSRPKARTVSLSRWSYPCFWCVFNGGSMEYLPRINTCKLQTCWVPLLLLCSWLYSSYIPHRPPFYHPHQTTNTTCSSPETRGKDDSLPNECRNDANMPNVSLFLIF